MTTTQLSLTSWRARVVGAALALAALAGAGTAQARGDVVWSVGVHSPGVSLGVANTAPVVVASGPVYYAPPPPVYYAPRPVYQAAPVVVVPRHGYYERYDRPYYKKHHRHHHHGYRDHDRRHGHRGHGHR